MRGACGAERPNLPQQPLQTHQQRQDYQPPEAGHEASFHNLGHVPEPPRPARRFSIRDLCDSLQPGRLPFVDAPVLTQTSPPLNNVEPSSHDVTHFAGASPSPLSPSARRRQDEAAIRAKFLRIHPPGFTFDRPLYERDMLDIMTEEEWMIAQEIWIAEAEEEERGRQARMMEAGGEAGDDFAPGSAREPDHVHRQVASEPEPNDSSDSGSETDLETESLIARPITFVPEDGVAPTFGSSRSTAETSARGIVSPGSGVKRTASELSDAVEDHARKRAAGGTASGTAGETTGSSAGTMGGAPEDASSETNDDWTIIEPEQTDAQHHHGNAPAISTNDAPRITQHLIDRDGGSSGRSHRPVPPQFSAAPAGPNSRSCVSSGQAEDDADDFVVIGAVIRSRACGSVDTHATTPTLDDDEDWREAEAP